MSNIFQRKIEKNFCFSICLSQAQLNCIYTVTNLLLPPQAVARLGDFGLFEGCKIVKVAAAPCGDPSVFDCGGNCLCLRNDLCKCIFVEEFPKSL